MRNSISPSSLSFFLFPRDLARVRHPLRECNVRRREGKRGGVALEDVWASEIVFSNDVLLLSATAEGFLPVRGVQGVAECVLFHHCVYVIGQ